VASVPVHVWLVLALAVAAVSSAAVIVSALPSVDPVALALGRTGIVALLLAPSIRRISRRDLVWTALAGACLAAHFAAWFASLHQTSVLRSTVLVCLGPIWLGLAEWILLRQPPRARYWLGLSLALPAVAALSYEGYEAGGLGGDLLAVLGGMLGAAYLFLGRTVRSRVGIGTYASLVCAFAAATLLPIAVWRGMEMFVLPAWAWAGILALALGPQLFGHNGFNYALRFLPASSVSVATLLEPVGATLLAWATLGQTPSPFSGLAGALVVIGVGFAVIERPRRRLRRA